MKHTINKARDLILELMVGAEDVREELLEQAGFTEEEFQDFLQDPIYEVAPDLLEACKHAIMLVKQWEGKDECWDILNAAITKAEGRG